MFVFVIVFVIVFVFVLFIVFMLVMSCLLITLIKCLKCHKPNEFPRRFFCHLRIWRPTWFHLRTISPWQIRHSFCQICSQTLLRKLIWQVQSRQQNHCWWMETWKGFYPGYQIQLNPTTCTKVNLFCRADLWRL